MITIIRPDNRTFRFDAVLNITTGRPGIATQHPIAGGAAAGDHLQKELEVLNFTGIVTESPIQGAIPQVAGPDRIKEAIEFLRRTQDDFCMVVYAGVGIFETCLLESMPSSKDGNTNQESFDITIVVMRVVESRSIRIVLPSIVAPAVADEAPTTQDIGPQAPKAASAPEEKKGSYLLQLGQYAGLAD